MKPASPGGSTGPGLLFILSALIAIGPFTMEAYMPALPTIAQELHAGIVQANFSISTFLIGLAIGQLVGGPISDQRGRKPNAIYGLSAFCLSSIGIMFSHDITLVQLFRFTQGLGVGFAAVVAMPTVRDVYEPEEAARKMPLVSAVMVIAPTIAPVFGAVIMQWSWRAIFGLVAILSIVIMWTYRKRVPETRLQKATVSFKKIVSQYLAVIKHRQNGRLIGAKYVFVIALSSGVFLTFLTNAAWIYIDYYNVSEFEFPLYFAIHALAILLANVLVSRLLAFLDAFALLRITILIQALLVCSMLAFVLTAGLNLTGFVVLVGLAIGAGAIINSCAMAMLFAYFHQLTGSASSLMAFMRFASGAALGALSGLLFNHTLLPILGTMLASSICCLILACTLPVVTLREVAAQPREEGL